MLEVSGESQGKSQFFNLFKLTIKDLEIKQEMRVVLVVGMGGERCWQNGCGRRINTAINLSVKIKAIALPLRLQ